MYPDIGRNSPGSPFAKSELEAPTFQIDSLKDEHDANFLDVKTDLDPPDWLISQEWMNGVIGADLTVSEFDIRLNDDVYMVANKESANNIFPVSPRPH